MKDCQAIVTELATSHGEQLRRFLLARMRNSADVPDVMQEVFLRMLRIPRDQVIHSPEAYLFTVARHVAQQHMLRQVEGPCSIDIDRLLTRLHSAPDTDPLAVVSASQSLDQLDRALNRLPPKLKATFILQRRSGLSLEQISVKLGISFPMAKKYLAKALLQVRRHLQGID